MLHIIRQILGYEDSKPIAYTLNIPTEKAQNLLESTCTAEGKSFFRNIFQLKLKPNGQFSLARILTRNSWRRFLHASLKKDPRGTRLEGSFKLPIIVIIFSILWLIAASAISITIFLDSTEKIWLILLVPCLGIVLPHFGKYLSKKDEKAVIELLDKAFSGHVVKKEVDDG